MWTKFSNLYYPTKSDTEYDYVYLECNEPCAKMFIKYAINDHDNYKISQQIVGYSEPTLTNVTEYVGNEYLGIYYKVRVITLQELRDLGLVRTNTFGNLINGLITYDDITAYLNEINILSDNPTSR
jgi:hypothetical protein